MRKFRWAVSCMVVAGMLALPAVFRAQGAEDKPTVNPAAAAKFEKNPNLPDCAAMAAESGDPASGAATHFVQLESGCEVPWHWHTPVESVMMVSGILRLQAKGGAAALMRHGDFAHMPSRHVHTAKCASSSPCVFFLHSDGAFDVHYVDKSDKEIPATEALKGVAKPAAKEKSEKR